ncbi:LmbE family protein [Cohnella sp. CIP 111063]|uniref:PIG-L family deacetylase n=1 Tax=unclassified Cohnella TaxID=2636738 RepID=UPI000B8C4823|nr:MULTISPECIES: PIG-L family deacetylase [unclassified Cohnella]OXS54525.1 LmbE family protein [Cohnella sp. CIP 111063]PRX64033.1 bacillithiol biosynthesis deacetylase BshB2 [Cohnella sp. SGD-V74]
MKNSKTQRKLLAVFAHPDDETFICGGTLAKYAAEGVDITLVSATRGEMGRRMGNPPYLNRESMGAARESELREACAHLGVRSLHFLDIRDKTVEFIDEAVLTERVAEFIRELEPDVVLTFHEKLGGHPDHCAIGKATTAAFRRTAVRGSLYFISFGDMMAQPERYGYSREDVVRVDVSRHLQAKLAAFRAHRCQTEIDEWVWRSNREALSGFGKHEYFTRGAGKSGNGGAHDLF